MDKDNLTRAERVDAQLVKNEKVFREFSNRDELSLFIGQGRDDFKKIELHDCLVLKYMKFDMEVGELKELNVQYFDPDRRDIAVNMFIKRMDAENPQYPFAGSIDLEHLRIKRTQKLQFWSHYDYCDLMLNPFFQEVFDKTADEMHCGGMVGAHGDKAYCHKYEWDKHGIPFEHGVMMFFLTYRKEIMGNRPKHESEEWVIENYPLYKDKLLAAEKEVLQEKFSKESDLSLLRK